MRFLDRDHAGRLLGEALTERAAGARPVVLGLSYGGVLVGSQVALALGGELDMVLVPPPGAGRAPFRARKTPLNGRYAILVDDGAATGETVSRAIDEVRRAGASRVVVALPVAPAFTATRLDGLADEAICLDTPSEFLAVGACYERFPEVTAAEAVRALRAPASSANAEAPAALVAAVRRGCEMLQRGLDELEEALARGGRSLAGELVDRWRRRLAEHLSWEESAVIPAYLRACGGSAHEVAETHAELHRSLLSAAADLANELSRKPGAAVEGAAEDLLRALRRKFTAHRMREVDGLAGVLSAGA